jgi:Tol biopolymer transport system component
VSRVYGALAMSPDGSVVVFSVGAGGRERLYKRRLADAQGMVIDGTDGAEQPFFSPDGQWLGYVVGDRIWKMRSDGGSPIAVADLASVAGASWGEDGNIVAGRRQESGMWRVSAAGGSPEPLTTVTPEDGQNDHRWPQVLPGGRGVLFSISTGPEETARIAVLDTRTGVRKDVLKGSASARYVPTGHLTYARNGELQAVPFDLDRLEITGPAVRVAEGVHESTDGMPEYGFSARGDLVYAPGWSGGPRAVLTLVGLDGSATETEFPRLFISTPRFSPDGRRIALVVAAAKNNAWVYDLDRASATRVTAGRYHNTLWTSDGRLVVSKGPPAQHDLVLRPPDVEGPEEVLVPWNRPQYPGGWAADGRLVFERQTTGTDWDILGFDPVTRQVAVVLSTPATEQRPRVSRDGRWLAYLSNESGRPEAYIRALAQPGGRQRVSDTGAYDLAWAPDGQTLYYTNLLDRSMWAARVTTMPRLTVGPPTRLFPIDAYTGSFDVSPDGTRFVMVQRGPQPSRDRLELVVNALASVAMPR